MTCSLAFLVASLVAFGLFGLWLTAAWAEMHPHYDLVVDNRTNGAIVLDMGDEGPPARTSTIPPNSRRKAFDFILVRPGDTVRFWTPDKKRVTKKVLISDETPGVTIAKREIILTYGATRP